MCSRDSHAFFHALKNFSPDVTGQQLIFFTSSSLFLLKLTVQLHLSAFAERDVNLSINHFLQMFAPLLSKTIFFRLISSERRSFCLFFGFFLDPRALGFLKYEDYFGFQYWMKGEVSYNCLLLKKLGVGRSGAGLQLCSSITVLALSECALSVSCSSVYGFESYN